MKLAVCALLSVMMALSDAGFLQYNPSGVLFCPCGWSQFSSRCFMYVAKPMSWADAQKNCQSMNANLASVHSAAEYEHMQKLVLAESKTDGPAWMGGSDAQQERAWFWIDGTPFTYQNWSPGQPDNYQNAQNCCYMNFASEKKWDDGGCQYSMASICVMDIA